MAIVRTVDSIIIYHTMYCYATIKRMLGVHDWSGDIHDI